MVELGATGALPIVATLLPDITATLTGVIDGTPDLGQLPPDSQLAAAVLAPVDGLFLDLSGAFASLADGGNRSFADQLLGSINKLPTRLSDGLGPPGVAGLLAQLPDILF